MLINFIQMNLVLVYGRSPSVDEKFGNLLVTALAGQVKWCGIVDAVP